MKRHSNIRKILYFCTPHKTERLWQKTRYYSKSILRGIDLTVREGETHAIMGPNGSGKSTLSAVLAGRDSYTVTAGEVTFNGRDILDLTPEERSFEGLFLSFQYPIEIPGVTNVNFMRTAVNEHRRHKGLEPLNAANAADFLKLMRSKMEIVEMNPSFSSRGVNVGFSGGEKKRNEIFQMAMLEPRLAILDETDSGLDVDALRIVATGVNKLKRPDNAAIVITHYQWTTSSRTWCTCSTRAASSRPPARNSPGRSRRGATTGSSTDNGEAGQ